MTTTREALKQAIALTEDWEGWAESTTRDERNGDLISFISKMKGILAAVNAEEAKPAPDERKTDGYLIEWHDTHGHRKKVQRQKNFEFYRNWYEGVTWTELVRRDATLPAPVDAQCDRDAVSKESLPTQEQAGTFIDEGSKQPDECEWPTCACALTPKDCVNTLKQDVSLINEGDMRTTSGAKQSSVFRHYESLSQAIATVSAENKPFRDEIVASFHGKETPAQPVQAEPSAVFTGCQNATLQNIELVLSRLEQLHKDSIPGIWRELIEEAMPCALAIQRAAACAQPSAAVPAGWKLVPDWKIGMRALFDGVEYEIFALGDRAGTFDICLPDGASGDRWRNVPPSALDSLAPAPAQQVQPAAQPVSGAVDERTEFELEASAHNYDTERANTPDNPHDYASLATQVGWAFWRARAALSSNQVAELEQQLHDANLREAKDYAELLKNYTDLLDEMRAIKAQNVLLINQLAANQVNAAQPDDLSSTIERGTKAWAGTPEGWVDDLRGGEPAAQPEKDAELSDIRAILEDTQVDYHEQGMGCGLEDRGITDRYEAMRYGWDEAIDRIHMEVVGPAIEAIRAAIAAQPAT